MIDETVADFIDDAADYMEKHGSTAFKLENEQGNVCMLGALRNVCSKYDLSSLRLAQEHLKLFLSIESIATFNDSHTHQERLDALRKCAKELRP